MTTFTGWLAEHESEDNGTGKIARWWRDNAGSRPRVSAPNGVQKFLDAQLRSGTIAGTDTDSPGHMELRGEWRELFADVVRAFQNRDGDAVQAGLSELLTDRLARIENGIAMLGRRLTLAGVPELTDAPGLVGIPPKPAGDIAAEPATAGAEQAAEPLAGSDASATTPEPAAAISAPSEPYPGELDPDLNPAAWGFLWHHADHGAGPDYDYDGNRT